MAVGGVDVHAVRGAHGGVRSEAPVRVGDLSHGSTTTEVSRTSLWRSRTQGDAWYNELLHPRNDHAPRRGQRRIGEALDVGPGTRYVVRRTSVAVQQVPGKLLR